MGRRVNGWESGNEGVGCTLGINEYIVLVIGCKGRS